MLDPACGDGAFLRGVLRHNPGAELLGIDIDPQALATLAACPQLAAASKASALLLADALADGCPLPGPSSRRAGVDVIVGNPPYVRSRRLDEDKRRDLRERFEFAQGQFDLTIPFVERSLSWLRPGGRLGFVLPNKVLVAAYARRLREALITGRGFRLVEVMDLSAEQSAFDGVCAYPVLIVIERGPAPVSARVTVAEGRIVGAPGARRVRTVASRNVTLAKWRAGAPARMDGAAEAVWGRSDLATFGEVARAREAVHTGNVRAKLVHKPPVHAGAPLLRGRDVQRWQTHWTGLRLKEDLVPDRLAGEYARVPPPEFFEPPKVLLREIAARPTAAYDDQGLRCLNKAYVVRTHERSNPARLQALAAILNSAPFARLFRARFSAGGLRGGHLQFKPQWLRETPLPDLDAAVEAGLHLLAARCAQGEELDDHVNDVVRRLYGWPSAEVTKAA